MCIRDSKYSGGTEDTDVRHIYVRDEDDKREMVDYNMPTSKSSVKASHNALEINSLEGDVEPGDRKATAEMAKDDGIGMGILPDFTVEKSKSIYICG